MGSSVAKMILVIAATVLVWTPICTRSQQPVLAFGEQRFLPQDASALHEVHDLYWQLGTIARDQQQDPIAAAHYFFYAAQAARQAGEEARAEEFSLAAQNAASRVDCSVLHDGPINQAILSPDGKWAQIPQPLRALWEYSDCINKPAGRLLMGVHDVNQKRSSD